MENQTNLPEGDPTMDQMLGSFRNLILNGSDNIQNPGQDNIQDPREAPEAQLPLRPIVRRIGNEIYDILALPWRLRVPTADDCDTIVSYYNLTLEIMRNTHLEHLERAAFLTIMLPGAISRAAVALAQFVGPVPPAPTSFQQYIFNCSMCYEMFSLLYANMRTPSAAPEPEPLPAASVPSSSGTRSAPPSLDYDRHTSSPLPNLPSSSFDCTNTPLSLDPNTPSTSTFFSFYEAAQMLAMEAVPIEPPALPIRAKKFSKNKKSKSMYQRPPKK